VLSNAYHFSFVDSVGLVGNQEPRIWKEEVMLSHLVLCQSLRCKSYL